jgi:uncharacterized membrane protein YgcG
MTDVSRKQARQLDDALRGSGPTDPDDSSLVDIASRVGRDFEIDPPMMARERALFVTGVGARKSSFGPLRVAIPALAVIAVLVVAAVAGRSALPGQTLYPVRQALGSVGLAQSIQKEFDDHLNQASTLLHQADTLSDTDPVAARRDAIQAFEQLGGAVDLLDDLPQGASTTGRRTIQKLEQQAASIIAEVSAPQVSPGTGDDHGGSIDNSGSGSGNSGSGSDDSGSGSSGSGSDDSSNSGSGSDDSGSGSSGSGTSGSGDSGSGGSGSDDSGSGSTDSGSGGSDDVSSGSGSSGSGSGSGTSGSDDGSRSDSGSSGSGSSGSSDSESDGS